MFKVAPFTNLGPFLTLLSKQLGKQVGGEERMVNAPHLVVATVTSQELLNNDILNKNLGI